MKEIVKILIIFLILIQGCGNIKTGINQFSSSIDTLRVKTYKKRGSGLFFMGVGSCYFQDSAENFPYPIVIPENIRDVKRMQKPTDIHAKSQHFIDIIKGSIDDNQVFIVDQNNNNDLTDDSARILREIDWYSEEHLIECKYSIVRNEQIVEEASWLRLGLLNDNLWCGKSEHIIAEFRIDDETFQVGIMAPRSGDFTYDYPPSELALFSHNSIAKDTLYLRDILKQGEVLELNNIYFRFENISHFGDELNLVKETNFDRLVGTQVGMIAPSFTCITVSEDTIKSTSFHDRTMIISNSCGCGGDKESIEAYYEIAGQYGDKIHILRLDSELDKNLKGNHIDTNNEFNKDIYSKYRKSYCSRICYVVNKNNRIIEKFYVTDWRHFLPQIIAQ